MNQDERKKVARKAVAKYATDPINAVREYVILSGVIEQVPENYREKPGAEDQFVPAFLSQSAKQLLDIEGKISELDLAAEIYREAQEEMLSLTDKFRHPVENSTAERMIFFADFEATYESTGWQYPKWYDEFKATTSLQVDLQNTIISFVKEAMRTQVSLNDSQDLLEKLYELYRPEYDGEDIKTRARRVIKALDIASKRQDEINQENAYAEYVRLVRHKGLVRKDATMIVKEKFNYRTGDSTLKALHTQLSHIKKRWEQEDPVIWERQNIKSRLFGLVLSRREYLGPELLD